MLTVPQGEIFQITFQGSATSWVSPFKEQSEVWSCLVASMEPDLYRALRAKDLAQIRDCLQDRWKRNNMLWWANMTRGPTPLHVASKSSSEDILMEVLRYPDISCNINTFADKTSVTPLHEAAGSSSPGVVRLLLKAGADLTLLSGDRSTALHIACSRGRLETCVELLRQGSMLEGRDGESMTPLLRATAAGRLDVTEWLIDQGADITAVDVTRRTPLAVSCYLRNLNVARVLLEAGAKVVVKNADGRCCAHLAVLSGKLELLCLMLSSMASSGERFEDGGGEMLYDAVDSGLSNVVDLLTSKRGLDIGVEIDRPNDRKEGTAALHVACFRVQLDIVSQLLSRGAAPDIADGNGLRPLHIACASPGSLPVVKALLDSSASANVIDAFGCAPVFYAFIRGNDDIVQYMLSRGASLYSMDYDQALRISCFYGMVVEVESLLWMEAEPNGIAYYNHRDRGAAFHLSVEPSTRDVINELLAENSQDAAAAAVSGSAAKGAAYGGQAINASPGYATASATSSEWTSDETEYSGDGECQSTSNASGLAERGRDAMGEYDEEEEDDDIGDEDAFIVPSLCTLDYVLGQTQDSPECRRGVAAERRGGTATGAAAAVKRWGHKLRGLGGRGTEAVIKRDEAREGRKGGLEGVKNLAKAKIAGVIKWASSPRPPSSPRPNRAESFFVDLEATWSPRTL